MLNFFKKKDKEPLLFAPIKGKCIPLEEVPDQVFAKKVMGDGVAFIPHDNQVVAPCDGVIKMIATTKHAIGIENSDGLEVLIHIGLDTVEYQGEGFNLHVKDQQKIKCGQSLVSFDAQFFESKNVSLITPMIITNTNGFTIEKKSVGDLVEPGSSIVMSYQKSGE